jgi:hypothetical protein
MFSTQAMTASTNITARRAAAVASTNDCVRASNVGAYASDPYTVPPCEPNTGF